MNEVPDTQHEDLCSDPQHSPKNLGLAGVSITLGLGKQASRSLELTDNQSRQSVTGKTLSQKIKVESNLEDMQH